MKRMIFRGLDMDDIICQEEREVIHQGLLEKDIVKKAINKAGEFGKEMMNTVKEAPMSGFWSKRIRICSEFCVKPASSWISRAFWNFMWCIRSRRCRSPCVDL